MPEVTVRDATAADATAIGDVWASAVPYLVRSNARVAADLREDPLHERRRLVGLVDDKVVGTATSRAVGEDESYLTVEVHADWGSRGVGSALLRALLVQLRDRHHLTSVCNGDPVSMAFAVRNNFVPVGEHRVSRVDPRDVPVVGPVPEGLAAATLGVLPELSALLETHNLAAADDPSGLSRRYTMGTFLADWWNSPDNATDLSWALVEDGPTPFVAAFTSVQVDRARGRAWSAMTATHPRYRGRGLARWVKARSLNALADAGVREAWTANDATNGPMIAVNDALGYVEAARSVRVQRRLGPR
ncbi:MAG: GNAT family N-acetyltransferase [Nocardioidaceae bacterium]|nr:GNAT family N-acetyltransferase [Nocardioidaceae bacterium]